MKRIAFAMLALVALPAFAPAPFPSSRRARIPALAEAMQGTWTLERFERQTGPASSSTTTIRIEGKRWIMLSDEGSDGVLEFALDPTKRPAHMDFSMVVEGEARPYSVGIVKVEGDTLTLVWIHADASQRPTSFDKIAEGGYRGVFRKKR